jgi:Ohr subfamily peroxiredoxin
LHTSEFRAIYFILFTIKLYAIYIAVALLRKDAIDQVRILEKRNRMSVNVVYTTSATATGGRDGHAATTDGSFDVKLTTPKELGGAGGPGNNPEQLFAAGYAACFIGAMKFVAAQGGPKVPDGTSVKANVGIGPRSEGGFGLDIGLEISLPGVSRADAEALIEKAHQVCPYSNATRNNVPVRLTIV